MLRKRLQYLFISLIVLLSAIQPIGAQHVRKAMEQTRSEYEASAPKDRKSKQGKMFLQFKVENGDTVYFDKLEPIWVFARGKGKKDKDWRKYYRLVRNFAKVYPYAEAAARLQFIVDSTFETGNMSRYQKEKYINKVQSMLFADFEGALRHMTVSQGRLLLKLIDRETGRSSYSIIKNYKNGAAAGFWQGIAKIFDADLKSQYDPTGEDKDIEELVLLWQSGTFPSLYYSIFFEAPPEVYVPDFYK